MHPVLLSIGPVTIYSFGFFIALGFVAASMYIAHAAREEGWNTERVFDLLLITVIAAMIGARILYILLHPYEFEGSLARMVQFFRFPGFSYPGALAGGVFGLIVFGQYFRLSWFEIGDVFAFALLVGEMIASIGCFLNACVFGSITYAPWGIIIPGMIGRRHPVPLYVIVLTGLLLVLLLHLRHRYTLYGTRQSIFRPGVFLFGVVALLSFRMAFLEFFRDDSVYWMGMKLYQVIGLFAGMVSLAILYIQQGRRIEQDLLILGNGMRAVLRGERRLQLPTLTPWRSFIVFVRQVRLRGKRRRRK